MKRALFVFALMLPVPFAALPLMSVAFGIGGHEDAPTLYAELTPTPFTDKEPSQLAYHDGEPDPLCADSISGF